MLSDPVVFNVILLNTNNSVIALTLGSSMCGVRRVCPVCRDCPRRRARDRDPGAGNANRGGYQEESRVPRERAKALRADCGYPHGAYGALHEHVLPEIRVSGVVKDSCSSLGALNNRW